MQWTLQDRLFTDNSRYVLYFNVGSVDCHIELIGFVKKLV